jgi:hypothetical protein
VERRELAVEEGGRRARGRRARRERLGLRAHGDHGDPAPRHAEAAGEPVGAGGGVGQHEVRGGQRHAVDAGQDRGRGAAGDRPVAGERVPERDHHVHHEARP